MNTFVYSHLFIYSFILGRGFLQIDGKQIQREYVFLGCAGWTPDEFYDCWQIILVLCTQDFIMAAAKLGWEVVLSLEHVFLFDVSGRIIFH